MEDLQVTFDFLHSQPFHWVDIMVATPLPGTELLRICIEKGYIKNRMDAVHTDFWHGVINTENFSAQEIEFLQQYHTLKKDFLDNLDMKNGRWERALLNFQYVINNNHRNPFAFYYAAQAAKHLLDSETAEKYYHEFTSIINENAAWHHLYDVYQSEGYVFEKP